MKILGVCCMFGMLACPHRTAGQSNKEQVSAIASALAAKDFDKALALVQPAVQRSPQDAVLWTLEGLAFSGKGDNDLARGAFQKALKISPDFVPALEGAAQLEYNAGSEKAFPLLNHILQLKPQDPTSHGMLGVLAAKKGDCNEALHHFELSGDLVESQPAMREEYATCAIQLKQPDRAIALYQKVLNAQPEDTEARCQLAAVQLAGENPAATLETLAPLLSTDKPGARVLQLAALAYEAQGDTPKAVANLREAILAEPHNVDLYLDFAVFSMDHQSMQVGIDMINVGLQAEPKAAQLYMARGVLYAQLANYDQAEKDFEKADELEPNQAISSVARGLEQIQANDLDQALQTVRSRLAKQPNDAYLLYLEANILAQGSAAPGSADFAEAVRSAKKAVSLRPTLVEARDVLAKLYLEAGQNQAAAEQCREILKWNPKDQTALYHLIQALRRTGETQEIPGLLQQLAALRAEDTKEERERNRYSLVESGSSSTVPLRQ
jgi:tetratricopeptide (TPR) repeat protein